MYSVNGGATVERLQGLHKAGGAKSSPKMIQNGLLPYEEKHPGADFG